MLKLFFTDFVKSIKKRWMAFIILVLTAIVSVIGFAYCYRFVLFNAYQPAAITVDENNQVYFGYFHDNLKLADVLKLDEKYNFTNIRSYENLTLKFNGVESTQQFMSNKNSAFIDTNIFTDQINNSTERAIGLPKKFMKENLLNVGDTVLVNGLEAKIHAETSRTFVKAFGANFICGKLLHIYYKQQGI